MPVFSTVALVVYGLVTGVAVLVVFKFTSRPARVLGARNRAVSRILELWLFRSDPWLAFRSLGSMIGDSFRYLWVLVVPLFASLVPVVFLLWLGHEFFAFRPLEAGERVMLVAHGEAGTPEGVFEAVVMPQGLVATGPPVVAWGEAAWELSATTAVAPRVLRGWQRRPVAPVKRLELRLPAAEYNVCGWRTSWLWGVLVASLVGGLVLKRPLRVEF